MYHILPTIERKCTGSIKRIPRNDKSIGYKVIISKVRYYKTHNTYEDAFTNLQNKNIEHELPIRNIIVVYPSYIEVELTYRERTKVSLEDLDIIQNDVWYYHQHGYAMNSNGMRLHNEIM